MYLQKTITAAISSLFVLSLAVPALAQQDGTPASATNLACVSVAVEKRDNAIISALDVYSSDVRAALVKRRDALKAAWLLTDKDQRKTAIRSAWDAFKGTWKQERKELNQSRKESWKVFRNDKKACHVTTKDEGESRSNEHLDNQL